MQTEKWKSLIRLGEKTLRENCERIQEEETAITKWEPNP
jgi:hypothetical protein